MVVFCFSFQIFFRILSKSFSDFCPKSFKNLSNLPSACADEQFLARRNFQKFWTVLAFLQKPLAWFSEFYLRVQSKNSGRNSFLNFSFRIFSNFERNIFRLLAEKLQEVFKTTFYVSRGTVCGLDFFLKIWIVLGFLQKPLAWFSKFHLRFQSKNSARNKFFIPLFRLFSDFERKIFQTFGQKTPRNCQN